MRDIYQLYISVEWVNDDQIRRRISLKLWCFIQYKATARRKRERNGNKVHERTEEYNYIIIVAWSCCRLMLTRGWMNGSFRKACASLLQPMVILERIMSFIAVALYYFCSKKNRSDLLEIMSLTLANIYSQRVIWCVLCQLFN